MFLGEAFIIALRSMHAARLRTVLTALGIVVGTAAVLVLLGLGNGMRDGFSTAFGDLSRVITVSKTTAASPEVTQNKFLRERDVDALRNSARAPDIASVTPLRAGTAVMRHGEKDYVATISGGTPSWLQVRNNHIVAGRMFTDQENAERARVVVIAPDIVKYLFNGDAEAALGAQVYIGRLTFKVIGVLASAGDDVDHFAPMPINTSRALFGGLDQLDGIGVVATSADRVPAAINEIYHILDAQHDITGGPNFRDYSVSSTLDQVHKLSRYVSLFTGLTLIVGIIALIVGTLGVANIMMVTVTQRTIEIGIRKAIGARRSAIVKQFLLEAVMLAGLGGILGVAVGVLVVVYCGRYAVGFIAGLSTPWVSAWSVCAVFAVSLVIGLVAGTVPAIRASRLNPIDALRF